MEAVGRGHQHAHRRAGLCGPRGWRRRREAGGWEEREGETSGLVMGSKGCGWLHKSIQDEDMTYTRSTGLSAGELSL